MKYWLHHLAFNNIQIFNKNVLYNTINQKNLTLKISIGKIDTLWMYCDVM